MLDCFLMVSEPTFEVIKMMVLRKFTARPTLSVEFALFEDLQEHVPDVRMGLFNFIEKNH